MFDERNLKLNLTNKYIPFSSQNKVFSKGGSWFESHYGQEFFILLLLLPSQTSQLDKTITNEIKRDIHLANILFLAREQRWPSG